MPEKPVYIVTGAFGYSGKRIAKLLIDSGHSVRTLTGSTNRPNPFGANIQVFPYRFDNLDALTESLKGGEVLYNTYWVRFNHKNFTHEQATQNSFKLFEAAKKAGIRRVVHISITNPSLDSPIGYFRCKARIENALIESGLSYAILRPAILFGYEDILVNNIAWTIRRLPIIGIFCNGEYKLQPIYVDDLANLAVESAKDFQNCITNAIGPETFTYRQLVQTIAEIIGKKRPIIKTPPLLGFVAAKITGLIMNDVIMTWDELKALMSNLLYVNSPPVGKTRLTDWAKENADNLGKTYASELARRRT
ncbi:MAG TPA: NAD(P)H-binding protein [Verrucomicrobiota bacterium]|nr:NAD(P)H-binding protein [Verrucomicrobiota bacterium]